MEIVQREHEILSLVAQGATNRQIARRLHLAESTISDEVAGLKARLGALNRANLIFRAVQVGWLLVAVSGPASDASTLLG